MMQRYIATSVQRRDLNISSNWAMVGDTSWGSSLGLLPSFFWRLSTKTAKQLARRVGGATAGMGLWKVGQKLAGGENKSGSTVELESRWDLAMATQREGFPFYTSTEMQRSSQPTEVGTSRGIRCWPHTARQWSAREVSAMIVAAGKRWQGDATASYHRGTEKDGVQPSKDLTVISREILWSYSFKLAGWLMWI
jgi:hypothetical protein